MIFSKFDSGDFLNENVLGKSLKSDKYRALGREHESSFVVTGDINTLTAVQEERNFAVHCNVFNTDCIVEPTKPASLTSVSLDLFSHSCV
jgi:hypothetical protein